MTGLQTVTDIAPIAGTFAVPNLNTYADALHVIQERKGHINLRDCVFRGHPAGQTGVYWPVVLYRKSDRQGHFGRDTGQVSRGHPAVQELLRKFYVIFYYVLVPQPSTVATSISACIHLFC